MSNSPGAGQDGNPPIIETRDIVKHYASGKAALPIQALRGVSIYVDPGDSLGVVGESGSGKSTLARLLVGLETATSGTLLFHGRDVTGAKDRGLRDVRRAIQMVFQDPYSSLNPRMNVREILSEPLRIQKRSDEITQERLETSLIQVGLATSALARRPRAFSGGQRQRIAIARALIQQPELLVLDEPVSSLDVSIQAQIINLLRELQETTDLALMMIAHDLAVVRQIASRVAVVYLGLVVEEGTADDVYTNPQHPYTHALLSAVPRKAAGRPRAKSRRIVLTGDIPSPARPPTGCAFRTRCWRATDMCAEEIPTLKTVGGPHRVACFHAGPLEGESRLDGDDAP